VCDFRTFIKSGAIFSDEGGGKLLMNQN